MIPSMLFLINDFVVSIISNLIYPNICIDTSFTVRELEHQTQPRKSAKTGLLTSLILVNKLTPFRGMTKKNYKIIYNITTEYTNSPDPINPIRAGGRLNRPPPVYICVLHLL